MRAVVRGTIIETPCPIRLIQIQVGDDPAGFRTGGVVVAGLLPVLDHEVLPARKGGVGEEDTSALIRVELEDRVVPVARQQCVRDPSGQPVGEVSVDVGLQKPAEMGRQVLTKVGAHDAPASHGVAVIVVVVQVG